MTGSIPWNLLRLSILAVLSVGLVSLDCQTAEAGGSWGSSRGGFNSGGSWGSSGGGLLSGRRPIRNLLSRVSDLRPAGSSGGSVGYGSVGYGSSGGSLGRRVHGSSGGWSGSSGGWSGSTGSLGSSGGYASAGSYYAGSTGSSYGSWGSSYISSYSYPMSSNVYSTDLGVPMSDYGLQSGYPMEGEILGTTIQDGGSIDSMLPGGVQPGIIQGGQYYEAPPTTVPGTGAGQGSESPGPVDEDDSTSMEGLNRSSVLSVVVPEDAQVFINDKLTTTTGSLRSYRSRNLELQKTYKYQVKAVLMKDGQELVKTSVVRMEAGADKTVSFSFDSVAASEASETIENPVTTLSLKVPVDAKVTLCGHPTQRVGTERIFETNSLKPGKTWKDYKVEVEFERDGTVVTEERILDLSAGQTYSLAIGVQETGDRIAAN